MKMLLVDRRWLVLAVSHSCMDGRTTTFSRIETSFFFISWSRARESYQTEKSC